MRPLEATTSTVDVNGFIASDVKYLTAPRPFAHEHPLPFFAVILAGAIEKHVGRLRFEVPASGAYAMPAEARHLDDFPARTRILTLEVRPASPVGELCRVQLTRMRRLRGPEFSTIARELATELGREDDGVRSVAAEGLALELIAAALRSSHHAGSRSKPPPWLAHVDDLVADRFSKPLRISEIADLVHVHPAHLARVYRLHHGETIGRRIRRLRLDWAKGRLVETDEPLREIAVAAGFAHQSHFTRVFKVATGYSPAQYRAWQRTA